MPMFKIDSRHVHMVDATVWVGKYTDGNLALLASAFFEDDGESYPNDETLSVNLAGYGMIPPPGHVYVKDYAEHEGLPRALEEAGVAFIVGAPVPIGPYSFGNLMKVADSILEAGDPDGK